MAALGVGSGQLLRRHVLATVRSRCSGCPEQLTASLIVKPRNFSRAPITVRNFSSSNSGKRPRFSQRLGEALRNSKITWYHIPVGVGIGFLGLVQFYKVTAREERKRQQEADGTRDEKPRRRPKIRPEGPW